MTAAQKREAGQRRKDGDSVADLARSYDVSPAAIYNCMAASLPNSYHGSCRLIDVSRTT